MPQGKLLENILVAGGTAQLPGLQERLVAEIRCLGKSKTWNELNSEQPSKIKLPRINLCSALLTLGHPLRRNILPNDSESRCLSQSCMDPQGCFAGFRGSRARAARARALRARFLFFSVSFFFVAFRGAGVHGWLQARALT